jgi:hypothetical protein
MSTMLDYLAYHLLLQEIIVPVVIWQTGGEKGHVQGLSI